jgi:hypothetical protein
VANESTGIASFCDFLLAFLKIYDLLCRYENFSLFDGSGGNARDRGGSFRVRSV